MTLQASQWRGLAALSDPELKKRVFSIIQETAAALQTSDYNKPEVLEVVPRLAEIIPSRAALASFRSPFSSLARASGLWNYIDKDDADTSDLLLAEAVTVPELDGITLHREQIDALNELLAGRNLILSAPTSFGKSLLVDALLASGRYRRVAIVLPTIALLDEFRRRLRRRFRDTFNVVMHPSDEAPETIPTIFLGTQERLITRDDLGHLDLTVVDEFYKLDPSRKDDRSVTLNAAVYKLLNRSKQFFFLGPNIDGVRFTEGGRWKFEFLRTKFATVAVDTFDLRKVDNKEERLLEEIADDNNWPALVFVSSPARANRLAAQAAKAVAVSDESAEFATWLQENVGPHWPLVETVRFGFGVHHGRLPRAIASHMVRLFNSEAIPVLFCTSTLIEGVNTAAKTVLIFDKNINKSPYDFFTYSNIRGRAGRLGQHHVGQVFLFNDAPDEEATEVAPTLFGDDEDAPDDYVVHLDEEVTTKTVDIRIAALKASLGLDATGLRLAASVGLDAALAMKSHVDEALTSNADLVWAGMPKYEQIGVLANLVCKVKRPMEFGAYKPTQLTYLIHDLRRSKTMKRFLLGQDNTYKGAPESYDNIFKFLRTCEYGLPQWFSVIELFVRRAHPTADYSLFVQSLSRWFKAEELKNLDEEGVPIQVAERFHAGESKKTLIEKLIAAASARSPELSSFEQRWILAAFEIDA